MKEVSLIGHAAEVYEFFVKDPRVPADAIIRRFFSDRRYLGSRDRRFIADVYFGVIKNHRRFEAIVNDVLGPESGNDPKLVLCAYLLVEEGIDAASVVEFLDSGYQRDQLLAMTDTGREIARLRALPEVERLAIAYSYPDWIVERFLAEYETDEVESILSASNGEAPTVLRVNTLTGITREDAEAQLRKSGCDVRISGMASEALVLEKRTNLMSNPLFRSGAIEVQDEASQQVAPFGGDLKPTSKVLDACAGAGGKTLHLAALLKNRGEIYATDIDERKLTELKRRVRKSGAQNVRIVLPADHENVLQKKESWFDLVLLDVPCTGTGTLRRNPGIKWNLTAQMLAELTEKQSSILEANAQYVKPGGALVYATCSLLKEEGENQIDKFVAEHEDFNIEETLRTRPDLQGCDGFFAARLRRKS